MRKEISGGMEPTPPHSSALRKGRVSVPGGVYFVTSNTSLRRPLLVPEARDTIIESLKWSRDNGRIWLLGYVVLDDHFHTILMLRKGAELGHVMDSLKRHTAR